MTIFYTLVLLVSFGREGGMTVLPGFNSRTDCESAGAAFVLEAKGNYPRFFCFGHPERNGTR